MYLTRNIVLILYEVQCRKVPRNPAVLRDFDFIKIP